MKKEYESIKIELLFLAEDLVRTSGFDNLTPMPDFPEEFVGAF